uniref:Uncharacterized protein n=2 Tax=Denticeps clupeoides TaxID=299321 RepID=A0AAY4DV65_9TELE
MIAAEHNPRPVYCTESIQTACPIYDTASILTGGPLNDTDSIQTAHQAYDTDSNQTAHLTYDTASNQTINPSSDTDSNHTIHPGRGGGPCQADDDTPTTSGSGDQPHASDDPPPYSPPDPKMTYFMYPPQPPHYSGQSVIACQPPPTPSGFYQPQFMPSPSYSPYAIYMNSPPLGEEQPPVPKDYLVESLLVTIFCCLMSGLIAVMYSYETRAALSRGDIREAERASQKARFLVMFSLMFGVFVCMGWIIYAVIALCV